MYVSPIVWGGFWGFGTGVVFKQNLKGAIHGAVVGSAIQIARQMGLKYFEQWAQRQLLYKLWQFQGTYAYRILASGANISKVTTTIGGAVVAGGLLGATAGSVGAIVLEKTGVISKSQEQHALGFYTGGIRGNNPNYWDSDPNDSGYFNIPKNVSTIWNYYF